MTSKQQRADLDRYASEGWEWTDDGSNGDCLPAKVATYPPAVRVMVESIIRQIDTGEADAGLDIAARILAADSPAAIERLSAEAGDMRDLEGHILTIQEVKWMRSDKPEGLPVYALLWAFDASASRNVLVTTGATNVVAFLFKAAMSGWLPCACTLRVNSTRAGNEAHWLIPVADTTAEAKVTS